MRNTKFAYHGETKVELEEDIARRAPVTTKPPPPKPPSTLSSDKPVEKERVKGNERTGGVQTKKGVSEKERIQKEKRPQEIPKEERHWRKWGEADRDAAASHYSTKTAREGRWGPANQRRGDSYRMWKSERDWEYVDGTWKWEARPKPDATSEISGKIRNLRFWEFAEWAYSEGLTQKQGYVQFLLGETDAQ